MGAETEIKLATTPATLATLLADPRLASTDGTEIREHLVSTAFDTADSRRHAAGAALRIREKGREGAGPARREQTLKLIAPQSAAIHRHEWNVPLPPPPPPPLPGAPGHQPARPATPDAALWPAAPRDALAALLGGAELRPLGATHVTRIRRRIHHGAATIDIMADLGEIATNGTLPRAPICELELELVEGDLADTLSLAATLPLGPDLLWLVAGKGARCRALARAEPLRASTAPPVALSPQMDVATAFHAIGWSCLNHLLANYPLVLAQNGGAGASSGGLCPDAVHQSRVAIRRLRAAFSLFGKSVADAQAPSLRAGFKAAAAALAPARDAHVLLERLSAPPSDANTPGAEAPPATLLAHLAAARDDATTAAQRTLSSGEFQRLLVTFALWLERGAWRADATAPLGPEVHAIFHRRQRKVRRLAHGSDLDDDEQLHSLRIEIKKLRYAIDFMTSALPTPAIQAKALRQERLLGKLQNVLGDLHDIALAASPAGPLPATFAALSPADAAELCEALATHTAALAGQTPDLLARAKKLLAHNAKSPHWWAD